VLGETDAVLLHSPLHAPRYDKPGDDPASRLTPRSVHTLGCVKCYSGCCGQTAVWEGSW